MIRVRSEFTTGAILLSIALAIVMKYLMPELTGGQSRIVYILYLGIPAILFLFLSALVAFSKLKSSGSFVGSILGFGGASIWYNYAEYYLNTPLNSMPGFTYAFIVLPLCFIGLILVFAVLRAFRPGNAVLAIFISSGCVALLPSLFVYFVLLRKA
jgi:hypothetical protein